VKHDTRLCREQVATLLQDEERQLGRLVTLLENEFAAVKANNLDELDTRGAARAEATGQLLRIQDERRGMLRLLQYPDGNDGLEQLLKWCDPSRSLAPLWRRCANLATQCRELNERNGLLVNARLRRVEGMLDVITQRPRAATYGPNAGTTNSGPGGLLALEA
jgi:flagella synthesis protein FlgN